MSTAAILRLLDRFPHIKALKEEDIPSLVKISRLRALAPHLSVLTGNNAVYLPLELSRGIQGPMSGFSHPEAISGIYRAFRAGRTDQAEDIFEAYLPLLNYENQGQWGVAVRKEVLRRRGAIRRARMRSPAPRLCEQELFEIEHLVGRVYHRLKSLGIDNVIGPRA